MAHRSSNATAPTTMARPAGSTNTIIEHSSQQVVGPSTHPIRSSTRQPTVSQHPYNTYSHNRELIGADSGYPIESPPQQSILDRSIESLFTGSNDGLTSHPTKVRHNKKQIDNIDQLENFMSVPPYAESTHIATQQLQDETTRRMEEGLQIPHVQIQIANEGHANVRKYKRVLTRDTGIEGDLQQQNNTANQAGLRHVTIDPTLGNQSGRHQDLSSSNSYNMYTQQSTGISASSDDKIVLSELVRRTPPCQSDYFEHIFNFLISIVPLFQLHLTPDFILMKYLLPKVQGQLSRIILTMASIQATFSELCNQIKLEFFCERTITQLATTKFFQHFQREHESITEFFDHMHAAYIFLGIPISQEQAVTIVIENMHPTHLAALTGRPWPVAFRQLPQFIAAFNRQVVISNQRMLAQSTTTYNEPVRQSFSEIPREQVRPQSTPRPYRYQQTLGPNLSLGKQGGTTFDTWEDTPTNITQNQRQPNNISIQPITTEVIQSQMQHNLIPNNYQCFNCGDRTHFRRNCPQPNKTTGTPSRPMNTSSRIIKCFGCNQVGHIQYFCPQKKFNTQGNA